MNIRRIVLCGIGACPPLCSAVFAQLNLPPAPAGVQVTQQYGWEFVTVNVSGNAPYVPANPETNTIARNRGQVSEPFRISRTEVTTGQWVEFLNVVGSIGPMPAQLQSVLGGSPYIGAINWGASREGPLGPGASFQVWDVPGADRYYVGGISWYMTALYCNWITNNRQASWQALSTGAYDTSTWGIDQNTGGYTDAPTHLPGARVWIPTLDQWLAATFYDPNRYGAGQPGWWEWVHGSDSPAVPGPPGVGTTPSGWAGGGG